MEYLKNTWNNISNATINWWYYFFGTKGSDQLLLEYVLMEQDLSTKCIDTGDIVAESKANKKYKNLIDNSDEKILNNTQYTFLFE